MRTSFSNSLWVGAKRTRGRVTWPIMWPDIYGSPGAVRRVPLWRRAVRARQDIWISDDAQRMLHNLIVIRNDSQSTFYIKPTTFHQMLLLRMMMICSSADVRRLERNRCAQSSSVWAVNLNNVFWNLSKLVDEPLSVHFVEDSPSVVIPANNKRDHENLQRGRNLEMKAFIQPMECRRRPDLDFSKRCWIRIKLKIVCTVTRLYDN